MISEPLMNSILRYTLKKVRSLAVKVISTRRDEINVSFRNEDALKKEITNIYENANKNFSSSEKKLAGFIEFDVPFDADVSLLDAKEMGHEIIKSVKDFKKHRIAQKKYIDLLACNMYVGDCLNLDDEEETDKHSIAGMERIKSFYSIGFLAGYFLDDTGKLTELSRDESIESLEELALDNTYSGLRYETYIESLSKKIDKEYAKLSSDSKAVAKVVVKKAEPPKRPARIEAADPSVEFLVPKRPHRKYFNLKARNKDILKCSRKELEWKRQYARLEYETKRNFIFGSFDAEFEAAGSTDKDRFYFRKEQEVYRLLFGSDQVVSYKQKHVVFPEEVKVPVNGQIPYEVLHTFNARYAALLGYTGDDYRKNDFMTNAIRKSYTDEGNAVYRADLIAARMSVGRKS